MTNHYHLLIETPDGNLSLGMRQLNGIYTQLFNKLHGRVGHLFQGRFKAILIQKDGSSLNRHGASIHNVKYDRIRSLRSLQNSHLLEVCRYTVLNPVR